MVIVRLPSWYFLTYLDIICIYLPSFIYLNRLTGFLPSTLMPHAFSSVFSDAFPATSFIPGKWSIKNRNFSSPFFTISCCWWAIAYGKLGGTTGTLTNQTLDWKIDWNPFELEYPKKFSKFPTPGPSGSQETPIFFQVTILEHNIAVLFEDVVEVIPPPNSGSVVKLGGI